MGRLAASSCSWTPRPSRASCWTCLLQVYPCPPSAPPPFAPPQRSCSFPHIALHVPICWSSLCPTPEVMHVPTNSATCSHTLSLLPLPMPHPRGHAFPHTYRYMFSYSLCACCAHFTGVNQDALLHWNLALHREHSLLWSNQRHSPFKSA